MAYIPGVTDPGSAPAGKEESPGSEDAVTGLLTESAIAGGAVKVAGAVVRS
jgi:hypothetical protein